MRTEREDEGGLADRMDLRAESGVCWGGVIVVDCPARREDDGVRMDELEGVSIAVGGVVRLTCLRGSGGGVVVAAESSPERLVGGAISAWAALMA